MESIIRRAADFNAAPDVDLKADIARAAAEGQKPTMLLITCVDSRIMTSVFAAAPGETLIVRNIGNLVPNPEDSWIGGDSSVASAVAFALEILNIQHVVVMGHSNCGGMSELYARRNDFRSDSLGVWLKNGRRSLQRLASQELAGQGLSELDRLSQLNVLNSREALATYPEVRCRLDYLRVTLHAWWFDIASAKILAFEPRAGRFLPVEATYEGAFGRPIVAEYGGEVA